VSTEDARALMAAVAEELGSDELEFHAGVSYRNLLIYRGSSKPAPFGAGTRTTPPHDLTDKPVAHDRPHGDGADLMNRLMDASRSILARHPVNRRRLDGGEKAATHIWLWGQGKAPALEPFQSRYGKSGAIITAVDLLRGLGTLLGWRRIEVSGATGYLDTDYAGKGKAGVEALKTADLVCVHVEATDEASHEGDAAAKIEALEQIDRHIVGPLRAALDHYESHRILVSPDHPTPLRLKTHSHGMVPFAIAGAGIHADAPTTYSERSAAKSSLVFDPGYRLMEYFLNG
jgi:2,3-bisphosphoglycerate-independent phosphoglycerate mutase